MSKLIKLLKQRIQAEAAANGGVLPGQLPPARSLISHVRAMLYPFSASNRNELSLKGNETAAIIGKLELKTGLEVDPRSSEVDGAWWKGRTSWIPKKWIEVLQRWKPEPAEVKNAWIRRSPESRISTPYAIYASVCCFLMHASLLPHPSAPLIHVNICEVDGAKVSRTVACVMPFPSRSGLASQKYHPTGKRHYDHQE